MPKFPSKVNVINIKLKIIISWIWKGHFSIWKGHFCIVCQKVEGPWPLWPPSSYVPVTMNILTGMIIHNFINDLSYGKQSCFIGAI